MARVGIIEFKVPIKLIMVTCHLPLKMDRVTLIFLPISRLFILDMSIYEHYIGVTFSKDSVNPTDYVHAAQ